MKLQHIKAQGEWRVEEDQVPAAMALNLRWLKSEMKSSPINILNTSCSVQIIHPAE